MFEDSLFASQHQVPSVRTRWTAAVSLTLQLAAAGMLILIPLFHVEHLPLQTARLLVTPPAPKPPPPPPRTVVQRTSSAMASLVPMLGRVLAAPHIIPAAIDNAPEPSTPATGPLRMNGGSPMGSVLGIADAPTPSVRVTPAPEHRSGPLRISNGVSAGLLLAPIRPVYPPIAKAAHVEGTVIVEAVISKTGTVESLHVVSGPAMLQTAALDAISAARYQPFRLNGGPTEVQTTITVNFRMGG